MTIYQHIRRNTEFKNSGFSLIAGVKNSYTFAFYSFPKLIRHGILARFSILKNSIMSNFKNLSLAFVCLFLTFNLLAQNSTEIKLGHLENGPISKVALLVKNAASSGREFKNVRALELSHHQETSFRSKVNGKIQVLETNSNLLKKLVQEAPDQISLEIPKSVREIYTLHLVKVNPFAEGCKVFTSTGGSTPFDYVKGVYYRGVIGGNENNSVAAISIFENEIIGSFSDEEGNMVIQPSYENVGELILYNDKDITEEFPFECLTDELESIQKPVTPRGAAGSGDCVRIYIECDYALYQNKGSTSNTINWITSVFNNMATLYANESINTAISEIFVWTSPDSYSKTSSVTALYQFKDLRPNYNGDLAHLAALGGNNIGGVAWLDVLCSNYGYAYSNISSSYQNVPTYSWTVEVMTHEMGHNLGSNHTQWCGWTGGALDNCYTTEGGCAKGPAPKNGGTIMSYCHLTNYGINFNNGFGPQPGDKIRAEVAAANCLNSGCGGSCNAPAGLAISNITQTTATASWSSVSGASSYTFEFKTNSGNTWTVVTTTSTNYNMTGLTSNTLYNTRVKTNCSSGSSAYSSIVNFTTSGSSCGVPSNLNISNITETAATAAWGSVSGALTYTFEYKTNSGSTWTVATTTSTSYNMSGLTGNTLYNTRVKANCASGSSAYSSTVNFTTASGGSCGVPTNLAAANITQSTATISWSPVSGANSYNFQYKLASGNTWSQVNVTTTVVNLTGMSPGTAYSVRVQAVCGSNQSAFTSVLTFTTSTGYCTSKGQNVNYEWVKRVNIGSIDRNSGKDGGYFDATSMSTDVNKGSDYTLNFQAGSTGSSGTLYWRVWIDFNNNGSFNDAGEQVISMASSSLGLLSASFNVPADAATASVRMRVSMKYGGYATSCQTFSYGEVEDYSINILNSGGLVNSNEKNSKLDNINLYPNPFSTDFHLNFYSHDPQNIQLFLSDPVGKLVMFKYLEANAGMNSFDINADLLNSGTYLMQIKSSDNSYFRKIVKLDD